MSKYPQSLIYFMWPYQVYFRFSCQFNAERVFEKVDKALQPEVFLIGFLKNERKDRHPICIDPEELDFKLKEFDDIYTRAKEHFDNHERRDMFYTGPGQQDKMMSRLQNETFKYALEEILNTSPNNKGNIYFAAKPADISDFQVFVVLQLNKQVYESHHHLKIDRTHQDMPINRSFLETLVKEFLTDCTVGLYYPSPGENLSGDNRPAEEIWRAAARSFMYTISSKGKDFDGLHGLFEACNKLSIERYEGIENKGHLIIAEKNNPYIEIVTALENPFSFRDYRKVRKLLQLSNNDLGMVCTTGKVLGLGRIKQNYDYTSESVFNVYFKSIHCWDVWHKHTPILQMRYGLPDFPPDSILKEKFVSDARRIFPATDVNKIKNLYNLSKTISRQTKGALLIISSEANSEAQRLKNQCFSVSPTILTDDAALNLSSIDGGVLIDPNGIIWAYGVILDGIVGKSGNSSRGSRYNSAVTYQEYKSQSASVMIVVVSEDRTVDIIPNLRPQIRHSDIKTAIAILEQTANENPPNKKNFNEIMDWFKNMAFYLTKDECDEINNLKSIIDNKIPMDSVKFIHNDFIPNSEMNDTYYLNEN